MFGIPPTAKFDHSSVKSMACRSSCPDDCHNVCPMPFTSYRWLT